MLKGHPKGLVGAALANMGERFGFYIMMAILLLFLSAKFGIDETQATLIYSVFYALIYILALVGGVIADKTKKYKSTILMGLICMTVGYALIAIPTPTPVPNVALYLTLTCIGLFVIAFGNGLFKGNLQAVVGQMYDNKEYAAKRDTGFQIFYMFINIGAMFAPLLAVAIRNGWLKAHGFLYNSGITDLCHRYLNGTMDTEATVKLNQLATEVSGGVAPADMSVFVKNYLDVFNTGFQYAFAAAVGAMLISLAVYLFNKNTLPDPSQKKVQSADSKITAMDAKEVRQRIYALFSVFAVVIFFWFSFHQNGVTLTLFAKEYTDLSAMKINLGFTSIEGAEVFQTFNPFFVVFLTPIIIGIFGWLRAKGKEPSTPKKIAIGMGIAAIAFAVMALGSNGLPSYNEVQATGGVLADAARVTPFLLIGTYFILTVAELFISPLGLSFVSKVAPPQYQGIMQGCWLGATAIGNQLLIIGTILYKNIPIWATWGVFVAACLISMFTMLAMVKWLERVAK